MRRALAATALAFGFAAAGASASPRHAPSPAVATAALGHLLHQRYGDVSGFWTCPAAQAVRRNIECLAEVHGGGRWHQLSANARLRNGRVVFSGIFGYAWTRHWWPYSRHFILRSQEPQVPGVVSVNSNAYDWGWLAMGARIAKTGHTERVDAFDGYTRGFLRFFIFACSRRGRIVTCRNAFGDVMRYRP